MMVVLVREGALTLEVPRQYPSELRSLVLLSRRGRGDRAMTSDPEYPGGGLLPFSSGSGTLPLTSRSSSILVIGNAAGARRDQPVASFALEGYWIVLGSCLRPC